MSIFKSGMRVEEVKTHRWYYLQYNCHGCLPSDTDLLFRRFVEMILIEEGENPKEWMACAKEMDRKSIGNITFVLLYLIEEGYSPKRILFKIKRKNAIDCDIFVLELSSLSTKEVYELLKEGE